MEGGKVEKSTMQINADIFPSTYSHDYIYFGDVKRPARPHFSDEYRLSPEQEKKFRSTYSEAARRQAEQVANMDVKAFEEEVATILKDRMQSVYMVDYKGARSNEYQKKIDFSEVLNPEKDAIIVIAEKMYIHQANSVPIRPLPSSRRVLGYSSLKDYLTGHSEYQESISKGGYKIIRAGLDRGQARLGPKYNYKKATEEVKRIKERENDEDIDQIIDIKPIDRVAIKFVPPPYRPKDKQVPELKDSKKIN